MIANFGFCVNKMLELGMSGQGLQAFPLPVQRITDISTKPYWRYQMISEITQQYLKQILSYEPSTGEWIWVSCRSGVTKGQKAGTPNGEGRIQIRIDGVKMYASRLAWLYMMGEWPKHEVDHINRINNDNRWANLRQATRSQNCTNVVRKKESGLPLGVSVHPGGFQAKISIDGRRKFLGLFQTPEEAGRAYLQASEFRKEYLPEEA